MRNTIQSITCVFALVITCIPGFAQDTTAYINGSAVIKQGVALHDEEKYEEALALYQIVSPNDSNYTLSLTEQIYTLTTMERYEEAIVLAKEGLQTPSAYHPDMYSRLATALDYNGQIEESLKTFEEGLALYPYQQNLIYNYGVTLRRAGKYKEAQEQFIKRLKLAPFHSTSHLQLAELSMLQGYKAKALMSYLMYLLLNTNDTKTLSKIEDLLAGKVQEEGSLSPFSDNGYEELDAIIAAQVAIGKTFKPGIKLDSRITRHAELMIKQLAKTKAQDNFWGDFYLPIYNTFSEKKVVPAFLYVMLSGVDNKEIQGWVEKNDKKVDAFLEIARGSIGNYNQFHDDEVLGVKDNYRFWYFDNGELNAIGNANAAGVDIGPYVYFYSNGQLSAQGVLNDEGKKVGDWKYYELDGTLGQTETYDEQSRLHGDMVYYYPNGQMRNRIPYKEGIATGVAQLFYSCGALQEDYGVDNNQIHGDGTTYYENGQKEVEYTMNAGLLDGDYKEYDINGNLTGHYTYKNGNLDGPVKKYYTNGLLKEEGSYAEGEFDGEWIGYFEDGQRSYVYQYSKGVQLGNGIVYHENGEKSEEYPLDDEGEIHGDYRSYEPDGKLHNILTHEHGKIVGYQFFDKAGNVLSEGTGKDTIQMIAYTPLGDKHFESTYVAGKLHGQLTHYFPTGGTKYTVNVENGVWQGEYLEYYQTGELKTKAIYKDDQLNGWHLDYHENGQISSEAMMVNGNMEQWYISYFPNGMVDEKIYYSAGVKNGQSIDYGPEGHKFTTHVYKDGDLVSITQFGKDGKVLSKSEIKGESSTVEVLNHSGEVRYHMDYYCTTTHGKMQLFLNDGQVESEYEVKDGQFNGPITAWYANGQLQSTGFMTDSEYDSTWTHYDLHGKKTSVSQYKKGMSIGNYDVFYENGQLESSCPYVDDKKHGDCKYYAQDGSLQLIKKYDKSVGIMGYQYMLENGELSAYQDVKNDTSYVITAYFQNGKKSAEQGYYKGYLNGTSTFYGTNGKVLDQAEYVNGNSHGWTRSYYADGQLRSEVYYENDLQEGTAKFYYPDGTLELSIEYKSGTKNGEEIWYAKDGSVSKKLLFWNDVIY